MKIEWLYSLLFGLILLSCNPSADKPEVPAEPEGAAAGDFQWMTEQFADLRILRYQIPGFDKLSLQQKKLAYYLCQAGLSGRDMMWDQNYRHNLTIRRALERIFQNYQGDKATEDWKNFVIYTKRVWFSNGIHHHYSMDKIEPGFSKNYFESLLEETNTRLSEEVLKAIFDPSYDAKKVNLDPSKGLVKGSAVNFYEPGITEAEVQSFYKKQKESAKDQRLSFGLNSKMVRQKDGSVGEEVYHLDGLYGPAIKEVIKWLEKAVEVAENPQQGEALKLLIEYYKTGDLAIWDQYNVAWVKATQGDVDYINSFIEVYDDPLGIKASYESVVQLNDFEASQRMKALSDNIQWFEDHSPTLPEHKKKDVRGVVYKVVTVAGLAGSTHPSSPIGINLPNANWIRADFGSKSVSLGNIIDAYDKASGPGLLKEFAYDEEEIERAEKYGSLADKMGTALHEVLGHASGKLGEGVGTPKETLQNYASTIEEARADIFALYFITDPKLIEMGLMPNEEAGKAEYDSYISNGLMKQLRRIKPGKNIEESHMRNRQLIASWAFEKGKTDNVISEVKKDGKTYFHINDYGKLRELFGELLREIQRIKSEGDYEAAMALVENYGVKVNPEIHQEVLERSEKLNIAPYSGFINPKLVPVMDTAGEISDIRVEYPDDFSKQMLEYAAEYSFLPEKGQLKG